MSELRFSVRAPSNIALIKYMGKRDVARNLPENASISMTLDSLCTVIEITRSPGRQVGIHWIAELPTSERALILPSLRETGVQKITTQVDRVRESTRSLFSKFGIERDSRADSDHWSIRSGNSFPEASGIASSASSFAAVTLATGLACARDRAGFEAIWKSRPEFRGEFAKLARLGSGSACRSLDGPWVLWNDEGVSVLPSDLPKMSHFVLLISSEAKSVSSSEAHQRVKTSPLWNGRVERVAKRITEMTAALATGDLSSVSRIAWSELWEMHSLFHTSDHPFSYWRAGTIEALRALDPRQLPFPAIVTLDAGPNVHVIVEESRAVECRSYLENILPPGGSLLADQQGTGGDLG